MALGQIQWILQWTLSGGRYGRYLNLGISPKPTISLRSCEGSTFLSVLWLCLSWGEFSESPFEVHP